MYCKKSGHQTTDYWSLARKNKTKKPDRNAGSSGSEQQRSEINLVATSHGEVLSLEGFTTGKILYNAEDAHTWLLDFSATFSVTPHREWFTDYSQSAGSVHLGNAHDYQIFEVGTISLRLLNGNEITLQLVRHVPDLKQSLISIGMLAEQGYKTTLNESR